MRVLVACEFSGVVRDAFRRRGHEAWSVDLLPSESPGRWHFQKDALWVAQDEAYRWDLMIAHPPCTHLAVSGARWFKDKRREQAHALQFVRDLFDCPIPRIALENPISIISSHIRKPDQIIQPWQFGHGETKATCFWLKNLPPLAPTSMRSACSSCFTRSRSVEREKQNAAWDRGGNGRAVGPARNPGTDEAPTMTSQDRGSL